METQVAQGEDEEEINEIISIKSEASILKQASEEIQNLVDKKKLIENKNESTNRSKDDSESLSENSILRARLQNQVSTGEITPFQAQKKEADSKKILGRTLKESTQLLDLEKFIMRQAEIARQKKLLKKKKAANDGKNQDPVPAKKMKMIDKKTKESDEKKTDVKIVKKKKTEKISVLPESKLDDMNSKPSCSNHLSIDHCNNEDGLDSLECSAKNSNIKKKVKVSKKNSKDSNDSGSEYVPSDDYDTEDSDFAGEIKLEKKKKNNFSKKSSTDSTSSKQKRVYDDGDEDMYMQRVKDSGYRKSEPLHKVDDVFKVPLRIWKHLYKYQRVSVKWLWELHTRNLGGLLGDEMGLGKTVQVIAFLAGLDCSDLLSDGGRFRGLGPTLIVCPATLLEQWVKHFHDWWPTLRVIMLHHSSTYEGEVAELLHDLKDGGILVVTYTGVWIHRESLVKYKWHYVILDEGHKIRNPEAKVTKIVKQVLTPHRLLLTGSPMQNSLKELWSLFDFILPGKLGTLAVFMEHCAVPITRGGYSNASRLQEATALQVATMLKNAITPYMLRRTKFDVQHHVNLPNKNEQVLFCTLTEEQRQLYKELLRSEDVSYILHDNRDKREGGRYRARMLLALSALRKICNHPDLYLLTENEVLQDSEEEADIALDENHVDKFGHWKRSGKMTVVRSLLKIWKKQGHRVLLFTQSRQMMNILELLVQKEKYNYLKMDGSTPMAQRQTIISRFNKDTSFFVFVLTTRVGGLGVNLTGADRVIIFDPDWNPATDAQARERAWRIGQDKDVTVYRLITAGTIEEKIYHRQVYKILLSNRVLEDPRQRRLFRTSDLTELFHLNEPVQGGKCESEQLFRDSKLSPDKPNFSSSEIAAMKKLASELSKKISDKASNNKTSSKKNDKSKSDEEKKEVETKSDDASTENLNDNSSDKVEVSQTSSVDNCTNNESRQSTSTEENINEKQEKIETESIQEEKPVEVTDSSNQSLTSNKEKLNNVKVADNKSPKINEEPEDGEILANEEEHESKSHKVEKNKKKRSKQKHKKSKKIKTENEISAMFEGEKVSCLIGRRLGRLQEPDPVATADDQYVLSKLFSKSAVSTAFQHESILSNAVLNPDEETPLQRAAKNTASENMECIKNSRKWCWKPNWGKPPEEDCTDDSE